MTLDDLLDGLFLQRPNITREGGVLTGQATLKGGGAVQIVGVYDATPLGVDEAIRLSRHVLDALMRGSDDPIFVLVDSGSQRMSKRDELLGVNEFLGHLAKCLIWADMQGRRTLGVLYGSSVAGAIIRRALSSQRGSPSSSTYSDPVTSSARALRHAASSARIARSSCASQ